MYCVDWNCKKYLQKIVYKFLHRLVYHWNGQNALKYQLLFQLYLAKLTIYKKFQKRKHKYVLKFIILKCSYLADSGIHHGVKIERAKGADVAKQSILQSPIYKANHGKIHVAAVKNNAIDIFATNVRHFGPTYSKTKISTLIIIDNNQIHNYSHVGFRRR